MTCRQMGGPCDAKIMGSTPEEMMKNAMMHLEQTHPDMAAKVKATAKDDPTMIEWNKMRSAVGQEVRNLQAAILSAHQGEDDYDEIEDNVSVVEEIVGMVTGQRAYEANSKVIQTADQLLSQAVNLKR